MNQSKNVIQERQKRLFDYITKHNSIKVSDASRMSRSFRTDCPPGFG